MTASCIHWWVFPMPDGEFSTGTCRKCGETQQARNWEPQLGGLNPAAAGFNRSRPSVTKVKPPTSIFKPVKEARNNGICSEPHCTVAAHSKGLCDKHYRRQRKAATA